MIETDIIVKCVDKKRDQNGKIIAYIIEYKDGTQKELTPRELCIGIYNRDFIVLGIGLAQPAQLIDIQEHPNYYSEFPTVRIITEADIREHNKSIIIGSAPIVNDNDEIKGVESDTTVFDGTHHMFDRGFHEENRKAIFNGWNPLVYTGYIPDNWYDSTQELIYFNEVIISNPCAFRILARYKYGLALSGKHVKIKLNKIHVDIVKEIYEIFKRQLKLIELNEFYYPSVIGHTNYSIMSDVFMHTITFDINDKNNSLTEDEIYNIVENRVKHFRFPKDSNKKLYSLLAIMLFVHSMWITTGSKDVRYNKLFQKLDLMTEDAYSLIKTAIEDDIAQATELSKGIKYSTPAKYCKLNSELLRYIEVAKFLYSIAYPKIKKNLG